MLCAVEGVFAAHHMQGSERSSANDTLCAASSRLM